MVSVPFTSGSSLQLGNTSGMAVGTKFQFPLHRDPRCNAPFKASFARSLSAFQFPLHRDPRCNNLANAVIITGGVSVPFTSGSSLQRILETKTHVTEVLFQFPLHRDPRCNLTRTLKITTGTVCFSSLYIGILAATRYSCLYASSLTWFQFPLHRDPRCNVASLLVTPSSLEVSVPFTSGSSLQPLGQSYR